MLVSPKEQAKKLYYRFAPFTHGRRGYQVTHAIMAKKNVLEVCDVVIEAVGDKDATLKERWLKVKEEAEKL